MSSPLSSPLNSEGGVASATTTGPPSEDAAEVLVSADDPLPQVQVDMSHIVGRIKEKPICVDERLKQEAMSAEELSKFAFCANTETLTVVPATMVTAAPFYESDVISSGSSTASRDSSDLSDLDGAVVSIKIPSPVSSWSLLARKEESERINHKMTTQTISRNGRQTQRWYTDPATQRLYRLTTGCVPVVEGGKILFVSSSRKPEWILPKGGWEMDEAMEESAIRETFEEAGVLGILGPLLGEIEYETRKAKKRRLEFEEVQRKAKKVREAHSPKTRSTEEAQPANVAAVTQAEGAKSNQDADSCSVASDHSQSYTHVKMKLFPLYVTDVRKSWPEEGRFRTAVPIDEAIRMTKSRPEFQAALKELKERNLHLPQITKIQEPTTALAATVSVMER